MSVQGTSVEVGTTATPIATAPPRSEDRDGIGVCVQNNTGVDVYLGGDDVTSSVYGHKLADGASWATDLDPGEVLYAAVATDTQDVHVILVGA